MVTHGILWAAIWMLEKAAKTSKYLLMKINDAGKQGIAKGKWVEIVDAHETTLAFP